MFKLVRLFLGFLGSPGWFSAIEMFCDDGALTVGSLNSSGSDDLPREELLD